MSGFRTIQCELPQKPWKEFSSTEIRRYWLRNMKNTDCSFIAEDEKDNKAAKVYRSFKWILRDMSPVLKEILNNKENRAKNCQDIVVSNPKFIEAILFYGHMKIVNKKIMNLVDIYEASKEYQVKALENEVIKMFESEVNQKHANWVKLFRLSYVKYPKDQQMRAVFEKVKGHVNSDYTFPQVNINLILKFNKELFDKFFWIMLPRFGGLKCFKITEQYLIQNFFGGNKNKKLEEIDSLERNLVEWYINKMKTGNWDSWDAYKNGPLVSNLLSTELKIKHLEKMEKEYNPRNGCHFNEIQLYIQKLRKGESNLTLELPTFVQDYKSTIRR